MKAGRSRHPGRLVVMVVAAVLLVSLAGIATLVRIGPELRRPGVAGTPFSDGGAWIYHYVHRPEPFEFMGQTWDYPPTPFASITAKLTSGWYTDRGVTNIALYAPYRSTGEFRGLPAIDFMGTDPANGSIDDVRALIAAANERGVTVTMYIALIYLSPQNPLFAQAERDRRDGLDSDARRLLRWDDREPEGHIGPEAGGMPPDDELVPRPLEGDWAWSRVAGRWYATSWGLPALDYAAPSTRRYATDVLRFWMDLGVQGFEYDAPQSYWGMQGDDERRQTEVMIDAPRAYRPDLQLFFQAEGAGTYANQAYSDRVGFSHLVAEGGSDTESFTSLVAGEPQRVTVDQLDDHWATWSDPRRANGRGVMSGALYDPTLDPRLRALEVAVKAGMGSLYQVDHEHLVENPANEVLPEATLDLMWDVFRAMRRSAALAPSGTRERLPTHDDPYLYAVLRRSADGSATAVNLYNFSPEPRCLTVDLTGAGITVPQTTTDLGANAAGPRIDADTMSVELPPYGWRFLGVEAGQGMRWATVDDRDSRWTVGDGWTRIEDPSAFGGSRLGGNVQGGWAELTVSGRTVEGWGRKGDQGAAEVEVLVDGVSHGLHSQQRTAPVPGGGGTEFYGQRLFTITDLAHGPHVVRIRQVSTSGVPGSDTSLAAGIDELRVSDDTLAPRDPVAAGQCDG